MTPLHLSPQCFSCIDLHWPLVLTISVTAGKLLWMIPLEVRCGCPQSSQIAPAWHSLLCVSGVCLKVSQLTMSKCEKWPCLRFIRISEVPSKTSIEIGNKLKIKCCPFNTDCKQLVQMLKCTVVFLFLLTSPNPPEVTNMTQLGNTINLAET